jgi:putative phosphoesterase
MKIGIIADSHDNLPKIDEAVRFFNKQKVEFVLHAGDYVAPFTILKLKALKCDWRGVFGNNDGERNGLTRISEGKIQEGPLRIDLDARKIILVHDINTVNAETEKADLIVCGHTHKSEIKLLEKKLIIKPGECGGWLSGESTVAVVDLVNLSAQIIKI